MAEALQCSTESKTENKKEYHFRSLSSLYPEREIVIASSLKPSPPRALFNNTLLLFLSIELEQRQKSIEALLKQEGRLRTKRKREMGRTRERGGLL